MSADFYAGLFIIAASLIGGTCLGLRLRIERRNPYAVSADTEQRRTELRARRDKAQAMRGR